MLIGNKISVWLQFSHAFDAGVSYCPHGGAITCKSIWSNVQSCHGLMCSKIM